MSYKLITVTVLRVPGFFADIKAKSIKGSSLDPPSLAEFRDRLLPEMLPAHEGRAASTAGIFARLRR